MSTHAATEKLMSLSRSVTRVVNERHAHEAPPTQGNAKFYCRVLGLAQNRVDGGFRPATMQVGHWFEVSFDLVTTDAGRVALVVRTAHGANGFRLGVATKQVDKKAGGTRFSLRDTHTGLTVCLSVVDTHVVVVTKAYTVKREGAAAPHSNGLATLHTNRAGVWHFQSMRSPEHEDISINSMWEWTWS